MNSQDNWGEYDVFTFGLYKVTTSESNAYFYIDYRDTQIGCSTYGNPIWHPIDLMIRYNISSNTFAYNNEFSDPSEYDTPINNGQLLRFWDMREAGSSQTIRFPNFWSNALAAIPSVNNHPLLVWGPINQTITKNYRYEIHRKLSTNDWAFLTSVNNSTFSYEDATLNLGTSYPAAYKIRVAIGEDPTDYTGFTNEASIQVGGINPGKIIGREINTFGFSLDQNYPNPFNPATTVRYQVPVGSRITLKIYDVLGNQINTLFEGEKPAGSYEISWDGANLPGGIYFCSLEVGLFKDVKKCCC